MQESGNHHGFKKPDTILNANFLNIVLSAYKKAFLTHISAFNTVLNQEDEKKKVLQADMQQSVSLCLDNSFCRKREQKVGGNLSQRSSGLKP